MTILGQRVLEKVPRGTVPVAGPYKIGEEDWMLERTVRDFLRAGGSFILVRERAPLRRHQFYGISVYRFTR